MLPDISIDTSTPFDAGVSTHFTRLDGNFGDGGGCGGFGDLETQGHPFGQFADVGDDGDHATRRTQFLDSGCGHIKGLGVERAEPLVEEQRIETWSALWSQIRVTVAERQSAKARLARKVSPPESDFAWRT